MVTAWYYPERLKILAMTLFGNYPEVSLTERQSTTRKIALHQLEKHKNNEYQNEPNKRFFINRMLAQIAFIS
ncbi:hypothetical protein BrE312_4059 [Brenneria sp. EniD312]|nr:hypothetical protein BrE312_4059 [Brenneria sp. EniD312]PWC21555.1 hypothetical protein DDT54_18645 [Brenneria nigrifluens DSM 30175 = ATCC 13028]